MTTGIEQLDATDQLLELNGQGHEIAAVLFQQTIALTLLVG